ncbi:MAG: phosphotransferase family protein [Candidatus Hodarchaeales archaeon]|jgi:aminoglycoside 3'-phosphotransferase-2
MEQMYEMEQELLDELALMFPNQSNVKIDNVQKYDSADTETYGFRFVTDAKEFNLILRLYREITDRAEREFNTINSLHNAGLSVPKAYLWRKKSKIVSRSYLIMEKIPGVILSDYLLQNASEEEYMEYFRSFIQEMVNIHSTDWKNMFPKVKLQDLDEDPYFYTDNVIRFPKEMINKFSVVELMPIIKWLEDNKEKSEQLSLLHGDFHFNNVILTPEKKLVVIDWADIRLGDFRHDLAFSIVATSSAAGDVTDSFTKLYESLSGIKVRNIEYFMILSILHNLLRCYSAITNPQITNENEITKNMFLSTYKNYTQYLVKIVSAVTGIKLPTFEKALN